VPPRPHPRHHDRVASPAAAATVAIATAPAAARELFSALFGIDGVVLLSARAA